MDEWTGRWMSGWTGREGEGCGEEENRLTNNCSLLGIEMVKPDCR